MAIIIVEDIDNNYNDIEDNENDNDIININNNNNDDDDGMREQERLLMGRQIVELPTTNNDNDNNDNESAHDNNNNHHELEQHHYRHSKFSAALCWSNMTMSEVSGSFGDFGTLLPLLTALARQDCIYLLPTLYFTGIIHVINGIYWNLPIPLQPMKSISAIALAQSWTATTVATSGICMGIFLLVLGITNTIYIFQKLIPISVIAGLQMGVGLRLGIHGINMIQSLSNTTTSIWPTSITDLDSIGLALLGAMLTLYWLREPIQSSSSSPSQSLSFCQRLAQKPPVGLYLFGVGIGLATITLLSQKQNSQQQDDSNNKLDSILFVNAIEHATWDDWKTGLLEGALPQLPLTIMNSVLSLCVLADSIYGATTAPNNNHQHHHDATTTTTITHREACISIGLMNIITCPFGCMPCCHGAGGLAGQYRLGATTGTSMIVLGLFKLSLVLLFGSYMSIVLDAMPISILGLLLMIAAHELATTGMTTLLKTTTTTTTTIVGSSNTLYLRQQGAIAMITTLVIVGTGQTHYGALSGWLAYMIYGSGWHDLMTWYRTSTTSMTR